MKYIDRLLQRWRIKMAAPYVPPNARLIDIGAHEGEMFEHLGSQLQRGFGVEPLAKCRVETDKFEIVPGYFPEVRPADANWDAITLLAVLEHIPENATKPLARACYDLLRPGGLVIITVPGRAVDSILVLLKTARLIDGMSLEEHHGFQPSDTQKIFAPPHFLPVAHRRFQLGLNHLFVFRRI